MGKLPVILAITGIMLRKREVRENLQNLRTETNQTTLYQIGVLLVKRNF